MVEPPPRILLFRQRVGPAELRRLVEEGFGDMVKYVVDVERSVIAVGGDMHADAEQSLLEAGSRQQDLWGANYYPGLGREECIEYTSLINIRPNQGNKSMVVQDEGVRERIRQITFSLIGEGEPF